MYVLYGILLITHDSVFVCMAKMDFVAERTEWKKKKRERNSSWVIGALQQQRQRIPTTMTTTTRNAFKLWQLWDSLSIFPIKFKQKLGILPFSLCAFRIAFVGYFSHFDSPFHLVYALIQMAFMPFVSSYNENGQ